MSISPAQTRAARVWLDWTQAELAARASVGLSTVRDLEAAKREPIANNLAAIRRALESGGAEAFLKATDGLATAAIGDGRGLPETPTANRQSEPQAPKSRRPRPRKRTPRESQA